MAWLPWQQWSSGALVLCLTLLILRATRKQPPEPPRRLRVAYSSPRRPEAKTRNFSASDGESSLAAPPTVERGAAAATQAAADVHERSPAAAPSPATPLGPDDHAGTDVLKTGEEHVASPPPLPPCAYCKGVSDAERAELARILSNPRMCRGALPHDGMLALGTARQIVSGVAHLPAAKHEVEHTRLLTRFVEVLAWRKAVGADDVLERGLPPKLMHGAQSLSWEYGRTRAGLPVFIDQAVTWRSAITSARMLGLTPAEYGVQRVYWQENCLHRTRLAHAAGAGNGQYIHIIDFGGVDGMGLKELREGWPYLKEAAVDVALNYGGCCARIYVARPPRIFTLGWQLCAMLSCTQPLLATLSSTPCSSLISAHAQPMMTHCRLAHVHAHVHAHVPSLAPAHLKRSMHDADAPVPPTEGTSPALCCRLRPFLDEATKAKVGFVTPRGSAPRISDYDYSAITEMTPTSLPTFLGGVLEKPVAPMHYCVEGTTAADTAVLRSS